MTKNVKLSAKLKFLLFIAIMSNLAACTTEEECETETVCFGDNNCIERPIPGSCF